MVSDVTRRSEPAQVRPEVCVKAIRTLGFDQATASQVRGATRRYPVAAFEVAVRCTAPVWISVVASPAHWVVCLNVRANVSARASAGGGQDLNLRPPRL